MATLDDIVNPVITLESSGITGFGFGTIMVAASLPSAVTALWGPDIVRPYTKASDMLAASEGFLAKDQAYKIVARAFAQNPKPALVKVGRRTLPQTQIVTFHPTNTTPGFVNTLSIQGAQVTHTNGAAETATTISTAMISAINALPADKVLAAVHDTTDFKCTSDAGFVAEYTGIAGFSVEDTTVDPGIATDLTAIKAADRDWYHLLIDSFGADEIEAAASWCDTEGFVFFQAGGGDTNVITEAYSSSSPADIASTLKASGIARTAYWWNQDLSFGLAAAICGEEATRVPGSSIYRYKNLSGPRPSDQLTAAQVAKLVSKNANYYQTLGNLGRTMSGKIAGSSYIYIDNVIFLDWWRNTCQVNLVGWLVSAPKRAFTDASIEQAKGKIEATNAAGVASGGITPGSAVVTAPKAADVPAAEKEARNLPDMTSSFQLAGAIETIKNITVTVRM